MRRRGPQRRRRLSWGRAVRPLVSAGVLAFGLLLSGAFVGITVRQNAVRSEASAAQQQIEVETARRAELEAQIAQRKTDSYVVDKARELGYVRPGEGLIAVEFGPSGEPMVRINASDGGRLGRWIALFFGR